MNTLKIIGGGGPTSCLSVRLQEIARYRLANGCFPDFVDSGSQFDLYGSDIHNKVYGNFCPDESLPLLEFCHESQFGYYDKLDIVNLSRLASVCCPLSEKIIELSRSFALRMENRTSVLYRGHEKVLETPRHSYEHMFSAAQDTGESRFFVQTDESEFFHAFKRNFPDSTRITETTMLSRRETANATGPYRPNNAVAFITTFIAAIKAVSMAPKMITTTGNTGMWSCIFRGSLENVWQVNSREGSWRKL